MFLRVKNYKKVTFRWHQKLFSITDHPLNTPAKHRWEMNSINFPQHIILYIQPVINFLHTSYYIVFSTFLLYVVPFFAIKFGIPAMERIWKKSMKQINKSKIYGRLKLFHLIWKIELFDEHKNMRTNIFWLIWFYLCHHLRLRFL